MDDEMRIPIATNAEDLFDDLREQTAVARLAEGLLRYTDPGLASATPTDAPNLDDAIALSD